MNKLVFHARTYLLVIILLLLVASNVFWAYIYLSDEVHDNNCLRENTIALAIMLAHASTLLREYAENKSIDLLGSAYLIVDHALPVAQALCHLTGGSEWKSLVSAIGSLHDLISGIYQGQRVSKKKLLQVVEVLENLSKALRNLDLNGIERYSAKLEDVIYG